MAFFDGKVAKFSITNTTGGSKDLSSFLTEVGGLPGPRNLNEVTALGDSGTKHIPGLEDVTVSLSGIFDDGAAGPDETLGKLRTHTAAVAFTYGPKGNTTGFVKYSGTCWVSEYAVAASVGDKVTFSASLAVEGTVGRGTF